MSNEYTALLISTIIGLVIIAIAIILLAGKGTWLIAGYNTMSKKEKTKIDAKKLARFVGAVLSPIGVLTPGIGIGVLLQQSWVPLAYIFITLGLLIFAAIYANTGNRFMK